MKIIIIFCILMTNTAFAKSISGVVEVRGSVPKGVLYIFAKKFDGSMKMPLAVKRIENPKFPLKFSLNESNRMMEGIPFIGPFTVTARLSPSGSVMDKSGIEVRTKSKIKIGEKDIKLILKNKAL